MEDDQKKLMEEMWAEEAESYARFRETPEGQIEYIKDQLEDTIFISKAANLRDAVLKWWVLHEHEIIRLQGQEIHKYNTEPSFVTLAKQLKKGATL